MVRGNALFAAAALVIPTIATATPASDGDVARVAFRMTAPEADQGVAFDGTYVYAVDNATIAKYRKSDGERVALWRGDTRQFPHINSCTMAMDELVCAASNYPAVPQISTIEIFDPVELQHIRSISLGMGPGSLTVINRHAGSWWAMFANYDVRGGEPARDHRYTQFARLDDDFRISRSWAFPNEVLRCIKPRSVSGAAWDEQGRILVSGHDRPQVYVLSLPEAGSTLEYEGWFSVTTHGQAIDIRQDAPTMLWSIDRATKGVVASVTPANYLARAATCD